MIKYFRLNNYFETGPVAFNRSISIVRYRIFLYAEMQTGLMTIRKHYVTLKKNTTLYNCNRF